MREKVKENEKPKVLLGELPALQTPEARMLMEQMSLTNIPQSIQMLALISPTNPLAENKPFATSMDRLNFARSFKDAYRNIQNSTKWHEVFAAEVLIRRILVGLSPTLESLQEEYQNSERDFEGCLANREDLEFSSPLEYLKARYGLKEHQIGMLGESNDRLPTTIDPEELAFLKNSIFKDPPPETNKKSRYREGRTITLPLDKGPEKFEIIRYEVGNYHDLIAIDRKSDGKQFLIYEGYIDAANRHSATEKIIGGTRTAVEGLMNLSGKTLDLISSSFVAMFSIGSIRPTFMEGRLRLIISPRATVYDDPRQPENQTFKGPNRYVEAFEKLKAEGVRLITPKILRSLGFKVPTVSIEGADNVQLRDHTRIKAAMTVCLPIVVNFGRRTQSYN